MLVALVLVLGCATAPATDDPASLGRSVYRSHCIACHQADGQGNRGTTGADFVHDEARMARSDEELLRSIEHGLTGRVGVMPAWGAILTEDERRAALAYIRATFGKKPAG
jgi:mono/diheme cytochrome c family protein